MVINNCPFCPGDKQLPFLSWWLLSLLSWYYLIVPFVLMLVVPFVLVKVSCLFFLNNSYSFCPDASIILCPDESQFFQYSQLDSVALRIISYWPILCWWWSIECLDPGRKLVAHLTLTTNWPLPLWWQSFPFALTTIWNSFPDASSELAPFVQVANWLLYLFS